jgi:uncharacterized RDD family membrane protein YckC
MANWYMQHGKSEVGPGSENQLRAAFEKGKVTKSTKVRKEDSADWVKLGSTGILDQGVSDNKLEKKTRSREEDPTSDNHEERDSSVSRFSMSGISVGMFKTKPTYNSPNPVVYASFVERAVALIIDSCLLCAVSFVLGQIFFLGALLSNVIVLSYFIFIQYLWGYTVGRKIMGMHVEMDNRDRPSIGVFVLRYFMSLLSGLIVGIGFLIVLSDSKMRALHDRIAETRVVKD